MTTLSLTKRICLLIAISAVGFNVFAKDNPPKNTAKYRQLQEGQTAFNNGNYSKSFSAWRLQAIKGNTDAQVFVGLSHANGWGVRKDIDQAAMWYEKAAEQNNAAAQFLFGIYLIDSSDKKREPEGLKWLMQAAANGDRDAYKFVNKAKRKGWFSVSDSQINRMKSNLKKHILAKYTITLPTMSEPR